MFGSYQQLLWLTMHSNMCNMLCAFFGCQALIHMLFYFKYENAY